MYRDRNRRKGIGRHHGAAGLAAKKGRQGRTRTRSRRLRDADDTKPAGPSMAAAAGRRGRQPAPAAKPKRKLNAQGRSLAAALLAALGVGGWYGHYWWTAGRYLVSTDDAYVGAKNTTLAAKVSGYVDAVLVEDNAHVRAGDVIAKIDDGDYRLAVDSARGKVATQQATIDRFGKQVAAQQAAIDQAKAQLASAQAGATRADLELARQQSLAARDYASKQALETAQANKLQSAAARAGRAGRGRSRRGQYRRAQGAAAGGRAAR